jgi:hypothetical protein
MKPKTQDQISSQDGQDPVAAEAERVDKLQVFGQTLASTRDKWIRARQATGWDRRVAQDLDQYHMKDAASKMASSMMDSVYQGYPVTVREAQATRSTVFVGITRQKTNAAEARLSDILLPTDDRNWGIRPTPDPEGARAKEEDGQLVDPATGKPVLVDPSTGAITDDPSVGRPIQKSEIAQAAERAACLAAEAMTKEIEDQFVECDYNSELRKTIHDSAVVGTGVIKGPVVTKRTRKAWRERKEIDPETGKVEKLQVMEIVEELDPASFHVDPRNVWEDPACGDDVQNGQGIFELEKLTEKKVRELAKQPGYMKDRLRQALEEGPKTSAALYETTQQIEKEGSEEDKLYQHWIYHGELKKEDLEIAAVDVPEDSLEVVSGCVEMINDIVVRAYISPLDSGEIPYDFYPWEKVQGSCRGYGMPYLMRAEQSVTNASWRQMMDNSGLTAGPQIIVDKRAIRPADGQWTLRPFKFWDKLDDSVDPRQAFVAVEFNSHQPELAGIIELAEKLGDQGSGQPMLMTGEKGSAPDTVGGMQMLMNNANVVLRRLVKQFDDYVTKKHIRRYYDYNMAYSSKDDIKGDFQIDARGSSALLVRDIQNQAYLQLLAAAANPIYTPLIDPKKLFEKALQAQHIDPRDIMLPDDQIKANQQAASQHQDPKIMAAQINAEARLKEASAVAQARAQETAVLRDSEVEDRRLRMLHLQLQHDLEIMKIANAKQISIDQVKAMLAQTAIHDRTKKELAASEMLFKQNESPDGKGI